MYIQHPVPPLSVSGRTLHWLRENSLLTSVMYGRSQRLTVLDAVHIQCMIMLETCRGL